MRNSLGAVAGGRVAASRRYANGVHRDAQMHPGIGLGVRGDDNVNKFRKLIRSVLRVGGEQDDDWALRPVSHLKVGDLVETTGISKDDCGLLVEALIEFLACLLLTVM